jgi:hypothetical protein
MLPLPRNPEPWMWYPPLPAYNAPDWIEQKLATQRSRKNRQSTRASLLKLLRRVRMLPLPKIFMVTATTNADVSYVIAR